MDLEDRILQYLPLLAPVPTAWMVGTATFVVLHFPLIVAVIAALVIEGLGFVAVNTAIQMRDFNRRLNVTEQAQKMHAPVGQAYLATALYTVVALAMTVLLHVFPTLAVYAPIPFILMGVAGAWMYGLRSDFAVKMQEREQGREQARQAREQARQARADLARKQDPQVAPASDKQGGKLQVQVARKGASKADKLHPQESKQPVQDSDLLAYWQVNAQASDQQVADHFGKSRQAIQQRRDKLIGKGEIKMTDQGVAVAAISVSIPAEKTV